MLIIFVTASQGFEAKTSSAQEEFTNYVYLPVLRTKDIPYHLDIGWAGLTRQKDENSETGWSKWEPYNLTGGSSGETVDVFTPEELISALESWLPLTIKVHGEIKTGEMSRVRSHKTLEGVDENSSIIGGLYLHSVENIIIKNINFKDSPDDSIQIKHQSHNILVIHNTFSNAYDEHVAVTEQSTNVTISWNVFYQEGTNGIIDYESGEKVYRQLRAILVGADHKYTKDRGYNNVTISFNHFMTLTRHPLGRFGLMHVYNNWLEVYIGVTPIAEAQILIERNFFKISYYNLPHQVTQPRGKWGGEGPNGFWVAVDNNVHIKPQPPKHQYEGDFFNPADFYPYSTYPAEQIPEIVGYWAGPKFN